MYFILYFENVDFILYFFNGIWSHSFFIFVPIESVYEVIVVDLVVATSDAFGYLHVMKKYFIWDLVQQIL